MADLEQLDQDEPETKTVSIDDLVVVAEFRDTIYPGLVATGKVQRGGDKPFHSVINGENYHVLKALTLDAPRGKVDAIYIDPPYNSGREGLEVQQRLRRADDAVSPQQVARVHGAALLLAKELLNPADSVLIVTIDEKEYLRLGLLLEQMFPEAKCTDGYYRD